MTVDFAMNGMMHRAMLREIDRVQKLIAAGDVATARKRYLFFSQLLHEHHEGEDAYLFPRVIESSNDQAEIATFRALEAEHEQLHAALDSCDADFQGDGELPASAASDLDALRLVLAAHCAHEEADGEPILSKYVTAEDLKALHHFNRQSEHSMLVFPWIADGGSAADQNVYGMLPGPVRLFLKPVMQRKYRAYFG